MAASAFLRPFETTMARYTDAPPIFHRGCALTLVGSLLSRQDYRCVLAEGVSGTWTNLWVVLVGDSGRDRKSTCIGMMEEILDLIDQDLRGPDDMSPEGLARHLYERDQQGQNPCALLVYSEFINLLFQLSRQYSQVLRPMLLKFYDVDKTYRRKLKKEVFEINHARLSMVGGIPADMLAQYGQPEDWVGGFFNRCLFVQGAKERQQADRPRIEPSVYSNLAGGLSHALEKWKKTAEKRDWKHWKLSEAARKIGRSLETGSHSEDTHVHTMLARTSTHFVKIAAIEQFDEDPTAREVGKAAAERAAEFVSVWQDHVPTLIDQCMTRSRTDFEGDKLAKSILRLLSKRNDLTREEIMVSCGYSFTHVQAALDTLNSAKRVKMQNDDGQPITYHLLKSGESFE